MLLRKFCCDALFALIKKYTLLIFNLSTMQQLLDKLLIITLHSLSILFLLMVLKPAYSCYFNLDCAHFFRLAINTSAVLLLIRKPSWLGKRYFYTLSLILSKLMKERFFFLLFLRLSSLRFFFLDLQMFTLKILREFLRTFIFD